MEFNKIDQNLILETPRLILRYVSINDKQAYFDNIHHDKDVLQYFVAKYYNNIDDLDFEAFIKRAQDDNRYVLSIVLKETNEVMGMLLQCSSPNDFFRTTEIGYAIGKKYWNHGYMSEAVKCFVDYLKTTNIHKISVSHFVENTASKRVIEKCGFIYEGDHIHDMYYHDRYCNLSYYYLLNDK